MARITANRNIDFKLPTSSASVLSNKYKNNYEVGTEQKNYYWNF